MKLVQSSACRSHFNYSLIFAIRLPSICSLVLFLMIRILIANTYNSADNGHSCLPDHCISNLSVMAPLTCSWAFVFCYTGFQFQLWRFILNPYYIIHYISNCVQFYQNHYFGRRVKDHSSYEFHLQILE